MFGTSDAKTVTLSFWVKSSLTGNFAVALNNYQASTRAYPAEYTINTADTWEKKTITIQGDTSGTWDTDNTAALGIIFSLGYGSDHEGTKNSWNSTDTNSFSGSVNLLETNGATLYITGVQLEVGDTATEFEHRPYDMELQRCFRYYWQGDGTNYATQYSNGAFIICDLPTHMRVRPTTSYNSTNATGSFADYSRTNRFQLYDNTDPTYNVNTPKADAEL